MFFFNWQKELYDKKIGKAVKSYFHQQHNLLLAFNANTSYSNRQQYLNILEDSFFLLADNQLTLPLQIRWHVLDKNLQDTITAANDDKYYQRLANSDAELVISDLYLHESMPDYPLANYGIKFPTGILDVQISVRQLHNFIRAQVKSKLLDFEFKDSVKQIKVYLLPVAWIYIVLFHVLVLGVMLVIYWVLNNHIIINKYIADNARLKKENYHLQDMLVLHNKYHKSHELAEPVLTDVFDVMREVKRLNMYFALNKKISISVSNKACENIKVLNTKKLVKVLTSVLHGMINQNVDGTNIDICVRKNKDNVIFIFRDNGYYSELESSEEDSIISAIITKNWNETFKVAKSFGATIEYLHTQYVGNSIVITINQVKNNNIHQLRAI